MLQCSNILAINSGISYNGRPRHFRKTFYTSLDLALASQQTTGRSVSSAVSNVKVLYSR